MVEWLSREEDIRFLKKNEKETNDPPYLGMFCSKFPDRMANMGGGIRFIRKEEKRMGGEEKNVRSEKG